MNGFFFRIFRNAAGATPLVFEMGGFFHVEKDRPHAVRPFFFNTREQPLPILNKGIYHVHPCKNVRPVKTDFIRRRGRCFNIFSIFSVIFSRAHDSAAVSFSHFGVFLIPAREYFSRNCHCTFAVRRGGGARGGCWAYRTGHRRTALR